VDENISIVKEIIPGRGNWTEEEDALILTSKTSVLSKSWQVLTKEINENFYNG
jgi:hypothetical protein